MVMAQKVKILSKLGVILKSVAKEESWKGFEMGITEEEYLDIVNLVHSAYIYNGWFTPASVKSVFEGIASWLTEEELNEWVGKYDIKNKSPKTVAIIMAGNIPLVGFHDFISVFLSGNKALIKLSSSDNQLFPVLLRTLKLFDPEIEECVTIAESRLSDFDAVIATGSDNSGNYFESYFGKYPNVIRKNRTSLAIIEGDETQEELERLGEDIFTYFGLGCRNVSMIWIPKDFELNRLYEAFFKFGDIINHNKYANNYDYNKAVYLLNLEKMLDNGFLLLRENDSLNSPLGMLHYARYESKSEVESYIEQHKNKIQVVVGRNYESFGKAQQPKLTDYADGIDTFKFLTDL